MSTFARLENSVVMEMLTTTANIATLYPPSLQWIDVTGKTVQVGWAEQSDGTFAAVAQAASEPIPATLQQLQAEIAALKAQITALQPHS